MFPSLSLALGYDCPPILCVTASLSLGMVFVGSGSRCGKPSRMARATPANRVRQSEVADPREGRQGRFVDLSESVPMQDAMGDAGAEPGVLTREGCTKTRVRLGVVSDWQDF